MKKIIVWSPKGGVGKTTIANYLSVTISNKDQLVVIVELNRYSAMSPYIQGNVEIKNKNIVKALTANNDDEILDCLVQSKNNKNIFTLSLTYENEIESLYEVNHDRISHIIEVVSRIFDYVFIDLPSDYLDEFMLNSFDLKNDALINVVDNDIDSWNKLTMYDQFFGRVGIGLPPKQILIINKDDQLVDDYSVEKVLKELVQFDFHNVFKIDASKEIVIGNNNGEVLLNSLINNKKIRKMKNTYEEMYKVLNNKE